MNQYLCSKISLNLKKLNYKIVHGISLHHIK